MDELSGPATIDELVDDCAAAGYSVTPRLVRDWTEAGLLDYPQRRSAGKGHGSRPALYPENQRKLLRTLLIQRARGVKIRGLAQIPVGIWMYYGDRYVPVAQARRALVTWLGDPRASKQQARAIAQQIVQQIGHPDATPAARRTLLKTVSESAYTGEVDFEQLQRAVDDAFEPAGAAGRRVGHPEAPLVAISMGHHVRARLNAINRLRDQPRGAGVSDEEFYQARHAHLVAFGSYILQQPAYAQHGPAGLYEPVTAESAMNECCGHLLTTLGLADLYPQAAARIAGEPAPAIVFEL